MRSASTPVGTMSAGPRKLPALAMLPVTLPSLKACPVSIEGSRSRP
jgi:hypothetical protein